MIQKSQLFKIAKNLIFKKHNQNQNQLNLLDNVKQLQKKGQGVVEWLNLEEIIVISTNHKTFQPMRIKKAPSSKSIIVLSLTETDKKRLKILSEEADMTNTTFIRMLIDSMWVARNYDSILKTGKFEMQGIQYEMDSVQLAQISNEIAEHLEKVDWGKLSIKAAKNPTTNGKKGYKKAA